MRVELRAIIFDFNGVIVDDEPLHLELFREVLGEEGIPLTEEAYRANYLGLDDRGAFMAALRDAGRAAGPGEVAAMIERKAARYREEIEARYLLFPGVVELVRELAVSFPMAIASGALRSEIDLVLSRARIRDCFQEVIASEDVAVCKPDPEGYLKALAGLNARRGREIAPAECLAIEDSIAGIEAARRAGMRCLAVTNSYPAERLARADAIVESLAGCDPAAVFRGL